MPTSLISIQTSLPPLPAQMLTAPPSGRRFGAFPLPDGVPASFFEPLPDEELDAWERA